MTQSSSKQQNPYTEVVKQAEMLLSAQFGQTLSFGSVTPIQEEGRSLILRCPIEAQGDDIPKSVVIKQVSAGLSAAKRTEVSQTSRNEQAVLQVLTNLSGTTRYAPKYYASDPRAGLLIFEDMGDFPTLQDVLYGKDRHQAYKALTRYGRYLARMQRATRDQAAPYITQLKSLGGNLQRDVMGWDLRDYLSDLRTCLQAFQIDCDETFDQAIHDLAQSIQNLGPFYTLNHCDAGPHNILVLPDQSILIDFELACFQHGFVDLVQARLAFPSAGLGRRSSPAIVTKMEQAYREELIKTVPELADDQIFERALVEACAHVLLTMLIEFWQSSLPQLLDATQSSSASTYGIQRKVTFSRIFLDMAESFNQLPYLHTVVQRLYDSLSTRWPEVEMLPYFPVFQDANETCE